MDKLTYLTVLLGGQLALISLDVRERLRSRHQRADAGRLRPASMLFLLTTIVVFGILQYAGLALVPNAEQLLGASRAIAGEIFPPAGQIESLSVPAIVLIGIAGFYFAGLCDYLFHRFISHSKPVWFTHENHHLPKEVAAYMPGMCVRPFAVVSVFPTTAIALVSIQLVLGMTGHAAPDLMPVVYVVVLVQSGILGCSHSAYLRRCPWFHSLLKPLGITTPQEHWFHHTSDLQCNYANLVTLWDRVFGTYLDPQLADPDNHRAGLAYDQDFLGTITLGRFKLSRDVRQTFQVGSFCHLEPAVCAAPDTASERPVPSN